MNYNKWAVTNQYFYSSPKSCDQISAKSFSVIVASTFIVSVSDHSEQHFILNMQYISSVSCLTSLDYLNCCTDVSQCWRPSSRIHHFCYAAWKSFQIFGSHHLKHIMGGTVVTTVVSLYVELTCSVPVLVLSGFFPQSKDKQVGLSVLSLW